MRKLTGIVALISLVACHSAPPTTAPVATATHVATRPLSTREAFKAALPKLADESLTAAWQKPPIGAGMDEILMEMVRRGGVKWEKLLRDDLASPRAGQPWELPLTLSETTALRRLQHRPDPVVVKVLEEKVQAIFPALPTLHVKLVNQDASSRPIWTLDLPWQWRIEATDEKGKAMPVELWPSFFYSGPPFQARQLVKGDNDVLATETGFGRLLGWDYLQALPPGKYRLKVFFHEMRMLSWESSMSDLIVCQSGEIELTVTPRDLSIAPGTRVAVRGWVNAIDEHEPMKVVVGVYDFWTQEYVPLNSPQAKILQMGFDAVPALIEMLHDKALTPPRRAWILSLLYSLTRQNDPRAATGVLTKGRFMMGPWNPIPSQRGDAIVHTGDVGEPEIDVQAQIAFAKKWDKWLEYIHAEERKQ